MHRAIIRSEGVGSLYSGVMSPCLFTGIWKGVTLFTHRQLQHLLTRHRGFDDASQLTVLEVACCASAAGAVGGAVLAPAELIKSRSQICSEPHSSPFQKELNQVRALLRPGSSPSRACRGLPLLLLRDGPATFVDLGCYELVKRYGQARDWPWRLAAVETGAMPAEEIIRIRYQGESRWNTYGEVARHVYATRGVSGFFLGWRTCLLHAGLRNVCVMVAASVATRGWEGLVWTFANFPLLGTEGGQAPAEPATPQRDDGLGSRSRFVPDEVITPHPRFLAFVANIRMRKGAKTAALLPLAADAAGARCSAAEAEIPSEIPWQLASDGKECDDPVPGRIYLDAAAFGAGSCCTQATFLCPCLSDARFLHDQFLVLAPLLLPLTASTPFWRSRVAATDTRIDAFSETWDDRTPSEAEASAPRASRAATSPQVYLAETGPLRDREAEYNDVGATVHDPSLQRLLDGGVDPLLARHVAHLFARDPLNVFRERLEVDNESMGDHWEQLQSSNWGTVRFKPPPARNANPGGQIGWRVEMRTFPSRAAPTDFENAAVVCVSRVLAQMILEERWDLYIPMSLVEENLKRSGGAGAISAERFHFRADFLGERGSYL
eukprot:s3124_g4.t3